MSEDPVVQEVIAKFQTRSSKGLAKYGTPLTRTDLRVHDWLVHLQEELMDAALYVQTLIREDQNRAQMRFWEENREGMAYG